MARVGHKREFEFALKSLAELGADSLSRSRVRKRVTELGAESLSQPRVRERVAESQSDSLVRDRVTELGTESLSQSRVMERVAESAPGEVGGRRESPYVVDLISSSDDGADDDDDMSDSDGDGDSDSDCFVVGETAALVRRKSGAVLEKKGAPSRLKELLETGLLEGVKVWYIGCGTKSGQSSEGLAGVIKGNGILCSCDKCKGVQIVTPTLFESHAGSAAKRPADYIHLENRNTLRDVLNACKYAKLDYVTTAIRNAISTPPEKPSAFCRRCGGPISDATVNCMTMLCGSCSEMDLSQKTSKPTTDTNECIDRSARRVPLQRACNTVPKSNSSPPKSTGKITRKDLRLHKLVFQDDVLPDGTELGYYLHGKKLLSGFKKGSGICCGCCDAVVSPSTFEAHAGFASRRKPYLQIYTSNGMSLHELSVKLSKEYGFSTDENDDLCGVCQGAGDLLCCDGCPRVFHLDCISLPSIPDDKWYCKLCDENIQTEKFAEQNPNAIAAGRIPGVDPMEQITNRCIRIVKFLDTQHGGCALCRIQDFCRSGFGARTVIICDQCEKEYHVGCMREHDMQDLQELPVGDWFCSSDCKRVNYALKKLLEQGDRKLPDEVIHVIKKKLTEKESNGHLDIRWRVLHGRKSSYDDTQPLLSKAVSVFHEQFDPILYGPYKQDLIPHMVYGRNVKETEFGGMYCAVLSVNSTIVSAGVFRVFSKEIAEIPLVATSKDCEGKGYFQCLYFCLESFLQELGVKNLLLPAAEETRSVWTNKFGFNVMTQKELKKLTSLYPLMIFDGTSMLFKLLAYSSS